MTRILPLGRRVELVPMDLHCHGIAIGLYLSHQEGVAEYRVHTYSGREGAAERIESVVLAMQRLGGMDRSPREAASLRFPCGADHEAACKRLFLESCKLEPGKPIELRALSVFDAKAGCSIEVVPLGGGEYRVRGEQEGEAVTARLAAIAGGFVKLAQMQAVDGAQNRIAFGCRQPHDAIMALLLPRALNVRAALREQEAVTGRGILVAPSAQKT